jgi:lactoylglutathione lyase
MRIRFTYTGIRVKDMHESLQFYTKVFGMKVTSRGRMLHGGKYVHLKSPGSPQRLELDWYPPRTRFYTKYSRGEELDHLAFRVDDVRDAFRELVRKGASVAVSPADSKGTEVYVKDPNGIWIELL